jgi:hypothetical protein
MKRRNRDSRAVPAATDDVQGVDSVKALLVQPAELAQPAANVASYESADGRPASGRRAYAPPTLTKLGTALTMSKASVQLCARAFGSGGTD